MSRSDMAGHDNPFEDDYRGFDVREDEAARGPLILALAVGVLLIFGGVVWNTYRQGVRPSADGLPSVIAEAQPFKQRPAEPGGETIAHTDKQFYDAMDASQRDPAVTPASLPASGTLAGGPPRDLRPSSLLDEPAESVVTAAPQPSTVVDTAVPTPSVETERKLATVTLPAPEPIAPLSSQARFKFAETGPFLVQIAALRSEEAAETAWRRVTTSAPELYHGASKRIQRADLGSEGVFYRLRVGAFAERADAAAFCEAIKESGATCIVVTG
ncbi:SPOR domain-containing protein [Hyphomonas sp. WL0036]|uniref:SPOR domain-containing protein n=1 Tax=Hyphomonas sediminis TaxID=2866160 RepID=UPI001C806987|nr:SPOR domain-containing protein [Hyphomonas sediminis]MBY9067870.1 SPOR domain-containing protein [Hyphomonas sediminis]